MHAGRFSNPGRDCLSDVALDKTSPACMPWLVGWHHMEIGYESILGSGDVLFPLVHLQSRYSTNLICKMYRVQACARRYEVYEVYVY